MLNISIVLYDPDWKQVEFLCRELSRARCVHTIYMVDNSKQGIDKLPFNLPTVHYQWNNGKNLGYGAAHNLAIRESIYELIPYHLVINPDVKIKAEDLEYLHEVMEQFPRIGSLMPKVVYPNGELQYLCKLLPTPWDVFGRRFLPSWMMRRRNERYELRQSGYDKPMNVPYLSGCFMLLRTQAVLKARLFDERYFMYPEDIDLTRTIHRDYYTMYIPDVTIIHDHQKASYHSWRMTWIHIVNMCRYFNKWGWFFDAERRQINRETLNQISGER